MPEALNRTLARGLEMLELLSGHPEGLELNQIAREMGLPKSSAFSLAHTLARCQYLRRAEDSGRFTLGLRMFEVGSAAVNREDVAGVLRRHMLDISRACNETMHCGIMLGMDILYIDKVESTQSIRMASRVGVRMPLHATAMGKAMLACLSPEEVKSLYAGKPLTALTPGTVTDLSLLQKQLEGVRAAGFAVEAQECEANVSCVAVAIPDRDGRPAYALSISAPSFRMEQEEAERWGRLLAAAREDIKRSCKAFGL